MTGASGFCSQWLGQPDPPTGQAAAYVKTIRKLMEREKYTEAEDLIHKSLLRFPDDPDLCGLLAGVKAQEGDFEAAYTLLHRLIFAETAPSVPPLLYWQLMDYSLRCGKIDEAERTIRRGLLAHPILPGYQDSLLKFSQGLFCINPNVINEIHTFYSLLAEANRRVRAQGASLIVVKQPDIHQMQNLSDNERFAAVIGFGHRPQFVQLSADLPYADDAYIDNIMYHPRIVTVDGVMVPEDHHSPYVNYSHGQRLTVGQPEIYDRTVYCVGSSRYCLCTEDKYTIPSCLQDLFNRDGVATRVVNLSRTGYIQANQFEIIRRLSLQDGDIVLFESIEAAGCQGRELIRPFCRSNGIFYHDFTDDLRDARPMGDIALDSSSHLNHRGNLEVARLLYDLCFRGDSQLRTPAFRRMDALIQFIATNGDSDDRPDPMMQRVNEAYADVPVFDSGKIGAIIMNCNPITKGHLHLIRLAAQIVNHLYIFVVEEDKSFFSFHDRLTMVRLACAELDNVVVVPSGRFILSAETFPEYFDKDRKQDVSVDSSGDIGLFGRYIAKKFGISIRFIGEEPIDRITLQYNDEMKRTLPHYGVQIIEIPRLESGGTVISASRVRALLQDHKWDEIAAICPPTTVDYLRNKK